MSVILFSMARTADARRFRDRSLLRLFGPMKGLIFEEIYSKSWKFGVYLSSLIFGLDRIEFESIGQISDSRATPEVPQNSEAVIHTRREATLLIRNLD